VPARLDGLHGIGFFDADADRDKFADQKAARVMKELAYEQTVRQRELCLLHCADVEKGTRKRSLEIL